MSERYVTFESDRDRPDVRTLVPAAGLKHLYRIGLNLINGSAPQTEEDFHAIQKMGVKTIVSVEAATPHVEMAKKYGMRYVHLPISYDKVPRDVALKITKLALQTKGGVYVHCFHGRHRSPAVTAFATVLYGDWAADEAAEWMRKVGVSDKYAGLYESVRNVKPATEQELAAIDLDALPQIAMRRPMAYYMACMDRDMDQLESIVENDWKPLIDHPDVTADSTASAIENHLRYDTWQGLNEEEYEARMTELGEAVHAVYDLRKALKKNDLELANKQFLKLSNSCISCHAKFRN